MCECLGGKPKRAMKVSGGSTTGRPFRFEFEHIRWDPKDGELCLGRAKPGETLVEARSDSDVQIDRQIWV